MRRIALALALGASACTSSQVLQGRIDGLWEIAGQAEKQGAYVCAPQELALAKAHLDFARNELEQGDQTRAEEHLVLAQSNANAALHLSPAERCSGKKPPAPGDRDGDGILDPEDRCPEQPEDLDGVADADGCPEDQDTDGDTLADSADLCVAEPEDVDGYLDSDGCPDEDNDGDSVLDTSDKCAMAAEDPDGFADDDGCPDEDNDLDNLADKVDGCPNEVGPEEEHGCPKIYKDVVVTSNKVVINQQVHFQTNKAKIRPESYGLLDTVAQVLRDMPGIRVEVQGHTDDRGADKKNLRLSQTRANAVREYLIGRGIEPYRMTAKGYGESRPIESNKTDAGRAANRRVEFVRTDEAAREPPRSAP